MQKFRTPKEISLSSPPKCIIVGVEGGSEFFLWLQSYSVGNSGPHAKIQNPRTTLFWEKSKGGRRKSKERENNSVNRGHFVCHAARLQRHPGSARSPLGPILAHAKGGPRFPCLRTQEP
jgi:hypothetical protein